MVLSTFRLLHNHHLHQSSPQLPHLPDWNSTPTNTNAPRPPLPDPWTSPLLSTSLRGSTLRPRIPRIKVYLYCSGWLFHLAPCFQDSSIWYHVSGSLSWRLSNIPLYVHTVLCLAFTHQRTLELLSFWLLWVMLLWTWLCKYLFKSLLSIWGGYIPKGGIAGSCANSMFNIWGTAMLQLPHLHSHPHPHAQGF